MTSLRSASANSRSQRHRSVAPRRDKPGVLSKMTGPWIYFVRIGDEIKIGYSTDVVQRFQHLMPDEVLALVLGDFEYEQAVHRALAPYRSRGQEWYRADAGPVLEMIDVVRSYANLPALRAA